MKKLHLLKFDFGEVQSYRINEESKKYFLTTTQSLLPNDQFVWASTKDEKAFYSIPIDTSTGLINTTLADLAEYWVIKYTRILKEAPNVDEVLIFDLRNVERDALIIYLLKWLQNKLQAVASEFPLFLIFVDRNPVKDDLMYKVISPAIKKKQVLFIDNLGHIVSSELDINLKHSSFKSSNLNVYDTFRKKLIRRIGHFRTSTVSPTCTRYFYDASKCIDEVKHITLDFIRKHISKKDEFEYIITVAEISSWLDLSALSLDSYLKNDAGEEYKGYKGLLDFKELVHDEINDKITSYAGGEILILTDMINTGSSLQKALNFVIDKFPGITTDKVILYSILTNVKSTREEYREIYTPEHEFTARFLHKVELLEKDIAKCPLCNLGLPFDDVHEESILKLKSNVFWEISENARYVVEPYKPNLPSRKLMQVLPNMIKWFENNSAYLIYKVELYLRHERLGDLQDVKIVYPDESNLEPSVNLSLETTFSGKFAQILRDQYNVIGVGIPRGIIDNLANNDVEVSIIGDMSDEWVKSIKRLMESDSIIIVDDLHQGGSTFLQIMKIMTYLGKKPSAYFPIIDFNPERMKQHKIDFNEMKFLCLYNFEHN